MNRLALLFLASIFTLTAFSQEKLVVLDPLIGDTIDKNEKVNFLLFPDLNDPDFLYGYITQSSDHYYFNSFTNDDSLTVWPIDAEELQECQRNIDKLSEYYLNKAKQDSLKNAQKLTLDGKGVGNVQVRATLIGDDDQERILDEVRKNTRLKDDAERMEIVKQGNDIMGNGARVEFFHFKRKKRK